jgi:hypothetical protein
VKKLKNIFKKSETFRKAVLKIKNGKHENMKNVNK